MYITRDAKSGTSIGGHMDENDSRMIRPRQLTAAESAAFEARKVLLRAAAIADVNLAVTDDPLPANVLAKIYRATNTTPATIIVERTKVSPQLFSMTRAVLISEIMAHPDAPAGQELTLDTSFVLHRQDGSTRHFEAVPDSPNVPDAMPTAEANVTSLILSHVERAPQVQYQGHMVRIVPVSQLH